MQRALELAERATGNTSPNPLVGAVIVHNNTIVGEGWHHRVGEAHAEVNAIADAQSTLADLSNVTLYVTLEPCSHFGKTPPCTEAILNAGIRKVVYATSDTNHEAAGGGHTLKEAGVDVTSGIAEQQARYVNRFFFHYQQHKTPFVIAKFASSLDGRTATRSAHSQWITGPAARQRGHVARQAVDAIVVGAQTAVDDNPQLTVRNEQAYQHGEVSHPLRILLDSHGRVPLSNALFDSALPSKTLVVTTQAMAKEHKTALSDKGANTLTLPATKAGQPDLHALMSALGDRQIQSVLVEGGNSVHGSFFDAGLVNEVWAFIAPMVIGGVNAAPSVGGVGVNLLSDAAHLSQMRVEQLDNDIFVHGLVKQGVALSSKEAS